MKALFPSKPILLEICLPAINCEATASHSTALYPWPDVFLIKAKQNTSQCFFVFFLVQGGCVTNSYLFAAEWRPWNRDDVMTMYCEYPEEPRQAFYSGIFEGRPAKFAVLECAQSIFTRDIQTGGKKCFFALLIALRTDSYPYAISTTGRMHS